MVQPRLPDSYFGLCYDGVQPWQGRGLSVGALNWHSARREEEEISANRGREFWVQVGFTFFLRLFTDPRLTGSSEPNL